MLINLFKAVSYKKIEKGVINFYLENRGYILPLIFILLYILLYFLIDYSTQSLFAHDEGLYARRARLIENSDNWFSPPFASPHHKTIGSYWLIALSIRFFGNSELALRLPSILSSFLCLIISYLISLKITNKKAALISLFSLSSMPLWIQYSRYASPDLPFVLCILLVIFFFLKSLDYSPYKLHFIYIFVSGLFISSSFFIRSYMAFVPLIGLSPFIIYQLFKKNIIYKLYFSFGILVGFIPTYLNLYFAVKNYGISGFTKLFDFARKQALGDVAFDNAFFIPLNFIYWTFPVGILILLLFIFTKPKYNNNYPLLVYCYPILSLIILLCMSTSYSHYYLFLLPSLSILFSINLTSNISRFSISKSIIKILILIILILISSLLLFFFIFGNDFLIQISYPYSLAAYIICSFLLLSYVTSIRFLFYSNDLHNQLVNLFYSIVVTQYISISLLYNFGILGNPNYNMKLFLLDERVSSITNSNTIYLYSVESKIKTLLSYYLPASRVIDEIEENSKYKYVITSDSDTFDKLAEKQIYESIKKFDKYILLMRISD
tara:strand:- start:1077 stop:2726 length:1650 start_codon:yes stop_codon:yes gene_type:complete